MVGPFWALLLALWRGPKKARVNAVNADGYTPLHRAAFNGHAIVADLLLAAGANPKAANKNGQTPAQRAEQGGKSELAEHLRQAEARAAST